MSLKVRLEVFVIQMRAAPTAEEVRRLYLNAYFLTNEFRNVPKGCEEAVQIIKELGKTPEVAKDATSTQSAASAATSCEKPVRIIQELGEAPEVKDATSTQSAASAVLATSRLRKPQLENPENSDPQSTAIAYQALTSLLLDPEAARKIEQWKSDGIRLYYTNVIQELGLNNESLVDIAAIQRAGCLNPEIILDPLCKKPKNYLNILRNNNDLKDLLDDFTKLANEEPIAAIITRPPQTFGIFYDPQKKTFLFFDLEAPKGLQLQLFRSTNSLVTHLMERKPIDARFVKDPEFYNTQSVQYQNPNACEIRIFRKKTASEKTTNPSTSRTENQPPSPLSSSSAAAASGTPGRVLTPRRDFMEKAEPSPLHSSSSSSAAAAVDVKESIALARRLTENEEESVALARSLTEKEEESVALARSLTENDEASVDLAKRLADEASVALAMRLMAEEEEE